MSDNVEETVEDLIAYVAYCFGERANKLSTINAKLAAVSHYHRLTIGHDLPMSHPWLSVTSWVCSGVKELMAETCKSISCHYRGRCSKRAIGIACTTKRMRDGRTLGSVMVNIGVILHVDDTLCRDVCGRC